MVTDHEIFDRFKKKKIYKRFKNGEYLRSLKALTLNYYGVHIDYGRGKAVVVGTIETYLTCALYGVCTNCVVRGCGRGEVVGIRIMEAHGACAIYKISRCYVAVCDH